MHRSLSIDIDGFIFLSSSDRKAWQIMGCTPAVKIYWEDFFGIASCCKGSRLRVLTSFHPVMQISRTEKWDTRTGAAGISCCPRWPDPHSWAIIYFIFADKLPERVVSDVNMEIDTTSNGPPLSFPVPSPHGEQTWPCKIHQSSTNQMLWIQNCHAQMLAKSYTFQFWNQALWMNKARRMASKYYIISRLCDLMAIECGCDVF